jgi:hypothetical protein
MDTRNPRQVLTYLFLAGAFFYLAGALWSAYFIVSLPQAEDWCKDWIEPNPDAGGSGFYGCVSFKNDVEASKYYHNKQMLARNRKWAYATIGVATLVSLGYSGIFRVAFIIVKYRMIPLSRPLSLASSRL